MNKSTSLDILQHHNGKYLLIYQEINIHLFFLYVQNLKFFQLMDNNKVNLQFLFQ